MFVIRAQCRNQFTAADIDFVVSVLGMDHGEAQCIIELLSDPESRDAILDHERLFQAILENVHCLTVSSRFYFYVLVRHAFKDAGIDDRNTADYVAELLSVFSSTHRTRHPLRDQVAPMNYLIDMTQALQDANQSQRFLLRAHLGNFALFFSGLFPEHIRHRRQRRAAPSIDYYESVGKTSFRVAGGHRLAGEYELSSVFTNLSDRFHVTRLALNDLSERLVSFDSAASRLLLRSMS